MQKAFWFDLNRCTGCGACMVACTIEKGESQGINRRQVVTFNETRHPALPVFSFSMACNHCGAPACEKNCPAAAISKDATTGAVLLDRDRCLGCKYCTWACPYDAPQYDATAGTVAKCDFCIERLRAGEEPACVCACPTDALRLDDLNPTPSTEPHLDGFTRSGLLPAIFFKYLHASPPVPIISAPPSSKTINALFESSLDVPPKKITLKVEWTLVVFTSIASILTAWCTAFITGALSLNAFLFLGLGGFAMALSTVHLGKKLRAYRAIFNLTRSWLSREIFLFSVFLGLGGLYLLFFPRVSMLGWVVLVTGYASLFAIDRIYQVALHVGSAHFHSAHALFNGLYLAGFLTHQSLIFAAAGLLKLALYLYRKYLFKQAFRPVSIFVSGARIFLGFLFPVVLFVLKPGWSASAIGWMATGSLLVGDWIDRTEYYQEIDIMTPPKQMRLDLVKSFNHIKNK